jgi:hypothetical protein
VYFGFDYGFFSDDPDSLNKLWIARGVGSALLIACNILSFTPFFGKLYAYVIPGKMLLLAGIAIYMSSLASSDSQQSFYSFAIVRIMAFTAMSYRIGFVSSTFCNVVIVAASQAWLFNFALLLRMLFCGLMGMAVSHICHVEFQKVFEVDNGTIMQTSQGVTIVKAAPI